MFVRLYSIYTADLFKEGFSLREERSLLCSSAVQFNPEAKKLQRRSLDQPSTSLSYPAICLDLFLMTYCFKLEHDENEILMHAMETVFGII